MGWPLASDLGWGSRPKLHGMQGVTPRIRGRVAGADLPSKMHHVEYDDQAARPVRHNGDRLRPLDP